MNFSSLYRVSVYVMLFLATLVMSIDATDDNPLAMLYPLAVAVASALAFLTVDRRKGAGLSRWLASYLALGTISLIFVELRLTDHLLLSLAHWLVYLQIIKVFLPKTIEDDWFLFALGLVQVLVGTVMSQSDRVGFGLFAWALSALWVLGLFYLHREAGRIRVGPGVTVSPAPAVGMPYPGLIDGSFLFASLRLVAITLALGGVIFLAMPRRSGAVWGPRSGQLTKHLTGFDEEVNLGQLGEILENDSVAMSIELFDGHRDRVKSFGARSPGELLWRGVSMGNYDHGRWHRSPNWEKGFSSEPRRRVPPERILLQRIKLEPNDTTVLFGLRPVLDATVEGRIPPELNRRDGAVYRPDARPGPYDYDVWSAVDVEMPQPFETYPDATSMVLYRQMPSELRARLRAIAEPLVRDIPEDDLAGRARALERYLLEEGGFGYTLQMTVVDPALDPIEDFLVNRKEGHCAYFASALTLMLRSIGIPARMINGFKGGDWNELASVMTVRQKHAHSWVEALVGEVESEGSRTPLWLTLDPTPGQERERAVASVGGIWQSLRVVGDFFRYIWVFYVVGFDSVRQERLVYQPIRELVSEAQEGFATMASTVTQLVGGLFHFPDVASFFSKGGFFVSFFALLLLAVAYWVASWLTRRLLRWFRGGDDDDSARATGVAFYRRLALLLADYGLERPPAETPREFARRAAGFLSGRRPGAEPLADVPPLVVDAFYGIRFGHRELDPEALRHVEARLDALEASRQDGGRDGG